MPPGRLRAGALGFRGSGYGALAAGVGRFELFESLFELLELLLRDGLRLLRRSNNAIYLAQVAGRRKTSC